MHQCIKFISFWNDTLHVSDGLSVHHQEFKTVHTATSICQTDSAVCFLAGTRWNIGASSWFNYRSNMTMHGPMNVRPTINTTNTTSLRFCDTKVSLVRLILHVWVVKICNKKNPLVKKYLYDCLSQTCPPTQ